MRRKGYGDDLRGKDDFRPVGSVQIPKMSISRVPDVLYDCRHYEDKVSWVTSERVAYISELMVLSPHNEVPSIMRLTLEGDGFDEKVTGSSMTEKVGSSRWTEK